MRFPRLSFPVAFLCVAVVADAAPFDDRVEALFQPPLAGMVSLSADGQRVAYTQERGSELWIMIMNLDPPGPRKPVKVEAARDLPSTEEAGPVRLRLLRWATASRLIYAPAERVVPLPPLVDKDGRTTPNPDGPTIVAPIFVVDVDGKERGTLVDAKDFQETPESARRTLADLLRTTQQLAAASNGPVRWRMPHLEVLGFLPRDRDQLILQTHGAYSPPRQHQVDLQTGDVKEFGGEWPTPPGEPQVFDGYRLKVVGERKEAARPATTWRDDELAKVQRDLEAKFPRRGVEILDWSETRARVLFRVTGGSDPGRCFVLQRPEDIVLEFLLNAPGLVAAKLNDTRFFECDAPDGARLSGYLTWPKTSPVGSPPPLVVVFSSGFPGRAQPAFDPEAQVLADLGFAVARLNHRSVAGVAAKDLTVLRAGVDRAAVDDARAAVEWLAARNPGRTFDRGRVATLGRGFGGYLAMRALQLQPTVFRTGIAIDAPMDLRAWLRPVAAEATRLSPVAPPVPAVKDIPVALIDHAGTDWKKLSVLEQAEALTAPVLILVEPGRSAAIDASTAELRTRLTGLGRAPETVELDAGFAAARPASRASVYRKIEAFLNQRPDGAAVKIGTAEEVK